MDLVRRIGLLVTFFGGWLWGPVARPEAREAPPMFEGERIPDPPRQGEPWTPAETTLSKGFVAATKALFELGLADPRGCEYREVEVVCHDETGGGKVLMPTRGWVLPATGRGAGRFVVCWNGLVYPAVRVGAPADLEADVRHALEADADDRKARGGFPDMVRLRSRSFSPTNAVPESEAVSAESILLVKASLLLRLGEEKLASRLWEAWADGLEKINNNQEYIDKPYIVLAENWTWFLFDRAVGSHASGDDRVALLTARALDAIGPRVAELAEAMGVQRYTEEATRSGFLKDGTFRMETFHDGRRRPLFLRPYATLFPLLADQERRALAKERPGAPRPAGGRAARVSALIRDLEEVSVRQSSQPGYPDLGESQTIKALITEGYAAVEPLLDVLEKDDRLTRTISFWRDYATDRHVVPVSEAAHYALAQILETSDFDLASHGQEIPTRDRIVPAARAYWAKHKDMPQEDRWYRTLLDDGGMPDAWVRAAAHIAEPGPAGGPRMRGEPLRGKMSPSVAELLARRIRDLDRRPPIPGGPGRAPTISLALSLATWDPAGSLPALRDLMSRLRAEFAEARVPEEPDHARGVGPGVSIAELTLVRVRAGDPGALDEYAAWIGSASPGGLRSSLPASFGPVWHHPDHPAMAQAAERLFGHPDSSWAKALRTDPDRVGDLVDSPLAGVAPFRRALLAMLADKTLLGKATVTPEGPPGVQTGMMTLRFQSGGELGVSFDDHDPLAPKGGGTIPFRACDYYAWRLSSIGGFPACALYWSAPKRDQAVSACAAFLERYGERIRADDRVWDGGASLIHEVAHLAFPRLDRPATAAEVRDGLAIFTLDGMGPVRVVPIAARPVLAVRRGLEGKPSLSDTGLGEVWQAEEVLVGGLWRRYYGFVGPGGVMRVPADEVEIAPDPTSADPTPR